LVFDRAVKKAQRDRAASDKVPSPSLLSSYDVELTGMGETKERSRLTDYVKDEVASNMVDRLLVRFENARLHECREFADSRVVRSAGHQETVSEGVGHRIGTGLHSSTFRSRNHSGARDD
jgi:hypothetical protein